MKHQLFTLAFTLSGLWFQTTMAQENRSPHVVFVVGTPHYNPDATLPVLANQLEESFGFSTTIVRAPYNPERNPGGIPGLEALADADIALFFLRFLTLPEEQFALIEDYLRSGKPVVGLRTSTHAFAYPEEHPLASWNDGFGLRAMGSKYFIHGQGTTTVTRSANDDANILRGVGLPSIAAGTLYLSDIPEDATPLLQGSGVFRKTGNITNAFGTHHIKADMTDDVAWIWTNEWGGRVFATTLGHPETFAQETWMRFFINGIHWAAGLPIPPVDTPVNAAPAGSPVNARYP